MVSSMCAMHVTLLKSSPICLQLDCKPWSTMRRHVSGLPSVMHCDAVMLGADLGADFYHALLTISESISCRSTRETKKAETALAELRGRAEAEKEGLKAAAAGAEERHAAAQTSVIKLEQELQSYKVCALRRGSKLFDVSRRKPDRF